MISVYTEKIKENEKKYLLNRKQHLDETKSHEDIVSTLRKELIQLRDIRLKNEKNITELVSKIETKELDMQNLGNHIDTLTKEMKTQNISKRKMEEEIENLKQKK